MCGRYTLSDPEKILQEMQIDSHGGELDPRFNVAPTQEVPVVRQSTDGVRHLGYVRWGLIPFWAKDPSIGNRMINARSETVAEKASFKHAVKKRRCLVVADGFYEWKKLPGGKKQPIHIHLPDRRPFAMAGLWERWSRGEHPVESCTILTTRPNDTLTDVHDRMPVMLPADARDLWLDASIQDPSAFEPLYRPFEGELQLTPVSTWVNNPRNDSRQCLEPVSSLDLG